MTTDLEARIRRLEDRRDWEMFDDDDPDRATCHSYMYAQHLTESSEARAFFLLRGSYTNHMVRTPDGWRIARLAQHVSWSEGDRSPT